MNPAYEEGMGRPAYLKGMTHMLSLQGGGGSSQTEMMAEEQVGKGIIRRGNSIKGKVWNNMRCKGTVFKPIC